MKITFMGAGSTVFARNVIGDCLCTEILRDATFALYDIDGQRLRESETILEAMRRAKGGFGRIECYLGPENRREALRGADFVVNAIQVGGYEPCTVIDFEIPKKYGLRQTIADTLGIGGIMRALRTIPVMEDFARDMADVCPDAWLLNYTNPMAMLTGYMLRYTPVKTVGRDLYPEIRERMGAKMADPNFYDKVRLDYIRHFGYYCTESSEHNAEYNPFYIKRAYPELIQRYNIPLDEYPRRCVEQIRSWKDDFANITAESLRDHTRSNEYASHIMEAIAGGKTISIGGNVLNRGGLISNLPQEACVEVPCLVNRAGVQPCYVGELPVQCAAMNMTNINVQLLTIEAARTRKRDHIYQAAMLDPHTAAELSIDDIRAMVDELIEAHGDYLPAFN